VVFKILRRYMEVLGKMLYKIKNILNNNSLDNICLTGFVDNGEDGVVQFYPDMRFLYRQI